jgi:hypothetical protein
MKTLLAIILFTATAFDNRRRRHRQRGASSEPPKRITEKKLANGLTVVLAPLPTCRKCPRCSRFDLPLPPAIVRRIPASAADRGRVRQRRH